MVGELNRDMAVLDVLGEIVDAIEALDGERAPVTSSTATLLVIRSILPAALVAPDDAETRKWLVKIAALAIAATAELDIAESAAP
ncbi:MAG: hypothetical protein AB7N54_20120 [Alphaproteobacteria bacterium]